MIADARAAAAEAARIADARAAAAEAARIAIERAAAAEAARIAAEAVIQKSNDFVKETQMIKLPENFTNYTAAQKIEYFNNNYIDEKMLLAEGVSQDDINWMKQNGYTGMPYEPIFDYTLPYEEPVMFVEPEMPNPLPKQTPPAIGTGTRTNTALPLILAAAAAYFIGG